MDPVIDLTLRTALALLFFVAAGHKLRDLDRFRATLAEYRLLPAGLVPLAAALVVAVEVAAAGALLVPGARAAGLVVAAALLALYGAAIAINLARGRRDIDCGCAGPAVRRPITGALVARNAALAALALAGGARRGSRRDSARRRRARRRGAEHAPLLPLADLPRLQGAPPRAALDRAPRGRLARDRAGQRRRARRTRGVRARRAPGGVPVRALAGARHHLPGGETALRGAARRVRRRALARAGEHARAPGEPVRGPGARRGVDPGLPPRRGGAKRSAAAMTDERRWLDRLCEGATRALARRTSRRSFLTRLGTALAGTAVLPLLPVARAATDEHPAVPDDAALDGELGDPKSCNYWRHCAIDGFLCACCGGSQNTCPPGTEMSPLTWIGTCRNPGDGKDYIISYNDCCGQSLCMRCRCTRTEGERPLYLTMKNNDLLWCFGTQSRAVNCSVAVVLGVATRT